MGSGNNNYYKGYSPSTLKYVDASEVFNRVPPMFASGGALATHLIVPLSIPETDGNVSVLVVL